MTPDTPQFLTPAQCADTLQVSTRMVCELCQRGDLRARKIGKLWRIHPDAWQAFLSAKSLYQRQA